MTAPTTARRPGCGLGRADLRRPAVAFAWGVALAASLAAQTALPAPLTPHEAKLTASDPAAFDTFGDSVALSGERALVGAPARGRADDAHGFAYLFELQDAGPWSETAKLAASDGALNDRFGDSVALSDERALVGAPGVDDLTGSDLGSAYVFERQVDGSWAETAELNASDRADGDELGTSVSLSGERALVGAPLDDDLGTRSGSAYLFERQGDGTWNEVAKLTASDGEQFDVFGSSVSLAGERALVGAHLNDDLDDDSGSAYLFERQGDGTWVEVAKLTASDGGAFDLFGISVALAGERALVGASMDSDLGSYSGSAYVFERQGDGTWVEQAKLTASDGAPLDTFGTSVALSGERALVGANLDNDLGTDSGSAYLFERQGDGTWAETTKLTASDGADQDEFGFSLALSGERAMIGAREDDGPFGADSGSAYLYSPDEVLRLVVTGTCPGSMTVEVTGAIPGGEVPMMSSPVLGPFTVPGGPCAGTDLDLARPRLLGILTADGGGEAAKTAHVPLASCGTYLQALDAGTCSTTDAEQVPIAVTPNGAELLASDEASGDAHGSSLALSVRK